MVAARSAVPVQKPFLGRGLVFMGTLLFVGEMLYGLFEVSKGWNFSGHLGLLAVAGMGLVRLVNEVAWNHAAMFAGSLELLVVCSPLALVLAGARLMKAKASVNE